MLNFAIDALATHRLTRLVIQDKIGEPFRNAVFAKFGTPTESNISFLVTCPHCVSMWAGIGVVAARTIAPKAWQPLAAALALSSVTGLLEER